MVLTILKWYLILNNAVITINLVRQVLDGQTKINRVASMTGILLYCIPMMVYLLVV